MVKKFFKRPMTKKNKITLLIILNLICVISLGMIFSVYGRVMYEEVKYAISSVFNDEIKNSQKYYNELPKNIAEGNGVLDHPLVEIGAPKDPNFSVIIPKLGINQRVLSDININDPVEVEKALRDGIGWAKGTAEPGKDGNSLLFSHSTQNSWDIFKYNAEFSLLDKLQVNDFFTVVYEDRQLDFMVYEKTIVPANDTSYLTKAAQGKIVTLQSCYPRGSDEKRILVRGRLVAMEVK